MKLKEKQQQMLLAAKEFVNGAKIENVMAKYHVSYASVYNAIKRYNLDYKYTYGRTIFFNESYFEKIDTEDKAYWLGFIFADGSISKTDSKVSTENRLTISISVKDKALLQKFAECISMPQDKIRHYTPKNSYSCSEMVSIYCNSIKMVTDLKNLNCTPRKTFHSQMPPIPEHLIRHFIRGYFDGDGTISGNTFEFTSDGNILHEIQIILMNSLGYRKTKIRERKNAFNLRYGGHNQLQKMFHYLYDDATIYLQRKYDKFLSLAFARS